ncbi:MAG: PH domain-containing protein [Bacilli bacterium]|nr:PH domain-containing protein [Bacilli bacterium]
MAKKKNAPDYNIILRPGEEILHTAAPGKSANIFFFVPALACFLFACALLTTSVWSYVKDYIPAGHTTITIAAVLFAAGLFMVMMRFVIMGRFYIVTNQRLIVTKGKARKSQMFLELADVYGVSINQNFIYRLFRLADIDFHSPSSQPRTKSFLIISFTSTVFKFNFLSREDGTETYRLLEQMITRIINCGEEKD